MTVFELNCSNSNAPFTRYVLEMTYDSWLLYYHRMTLSEDYSDLASGHVFPCHIDINDEYEQHNTENSEEGNKNETNG